ncbi:MAG TPA: hypothetical protein VN843_18895, partial [Anaerolineales bacterium]|nr:hypothetical protein [Anaerolineales bacterium]
LRLSLKSRNTTQTKKIAFEGEAAGPATPKGSFLFEPVAGGTKITLLPWPVSRGLFRLLESIMPASAAVHRARASNFISLQISPDQQIKIDFWQNILLRECRL